MIGNLLAWLIIGLIAGWLASMIMGRGGYGIVFVDSHFHSFAAAVGSGWNGIGHSVPDKLVGRIIV